MRRSGHWERLAQQHLAARPLLGQQLQVGQVEHHLPLRGQESGQLIEQGQAGQGFVHQAQGQGRIEVGAHLAGIGLQLRAVEHQRGLSEPSLTQGTGQDLEARGMGGAGLPGAQGPDRSAAPQGRSTQPASTCPVRHLQALR